VLHRNKAAFPLSSSDFKENDISIINFANKLNETYCYPVAREYDPLNQSFNGGVLISIFTPNSFSFDKNDLNTYSGLYIFGYAGKKVILTGDNNREILLKMMRSDQKFVDCVANTDILLAPHHGRDSDFCKEFFDLVNPKLTIISDGSIKHDSQQKSTDNYKGSGVQVGDGIRYTFTTRKDGLITLTISNDGYVSIDTQVEQERREMLQNLSIGLKKLMRTNGKL
jgi:competence protein ComEC